MEQNRELILAKLMEIYKAETIKMSNDAKYREDKGKYNALAAYCTYATIGGPRDLYFESNLQWVMPEALLNLAASKVGLAGKSKDSAICELAIMCISHMQLVDMQLTFNYSKTKTVVVIKKHNAQIKHIEIDTGDSRERATRKWFDSVVDRLTTYIHYTLNAETMSINVYNESYANRFREAYKRLDEAGRELSCV